MNQDLEGFDREGNRSEFVRHCKNTSEVIRWQLVKKASDGKGMPTGFRLRTRHNDCPIDSQPNQPAREIWAYIPFLFSGLIIMSPFTIKVCKLGLSETYNRHKAR